MEHVLRQCLIATRLAERIGLDEQQRAGVYYTALLINVGCHTDAHEQAKWFGDDIDMKSTKYDYEPKSFREAVAVLRQFGAGRSPAATGAHRGRVRTARTPRRRGHDRPARQAGPHAGRGAAAERSCVRSPRRRLRAVGRQGLARRAARRRRPHRRAASRSWPSTSRWRNGCAASTRHVSSRGTGRARSSTRRSSTCLEADADAIFAGLDSVGTWSAVIDAEPALTIRLSDEQFDAALLAIANFVDLKSPFTLGHSRAVAELAAAAGERARTRAGRGTGPAASRTRPRLRPARRVERHLGQGGPARRRGMGAGADAAVPHRPDAPAVRGARAARCTGDPAPRAPRRFRVPPRAVGDGDLPAGARPRCRRRLPVDARAPPIPSRSIGRRGRERAATPR